MLQTHPLKEASPSRDLSLLPTSHDYCLWPVVLIPGGFCQLLTKGNLGGVPGLPGTRDLPVTQCCTWKEVLNTAVLGKFVGKLNGKSIFSLFVQDRARWTTCHMLVPLAESRIVCRRASYVRTISGHAFSEARS